MRAGGLTFGAAFQPAFISASNTNNKEPINGQHSLLKGNECLDFSPRSAQYNAPGPFWVMKMAQGRLKPFFSPLSPDSNQDPVVLQN